MRSLIGLLGGAFDPVHRGHLHIAQVLLSELPFSSIRFIPCYSPPHRSTLTASPTQRLAMLQLALQDIKQPGLAIDTWEIDQKKTSYTIDTLQALCQPTTEHAYGLIMSSEAWHQFHTWRNWERILQWTHLIIVDRPGYILTDASTPAPLLKLLRDCRTMDANDLLKEGAGQLFYYPIPSGLSISATRIRGALKGMPPDLQAKEKRPIQCRQALEQLTPSVADYILKYKIYE